MGKLPSRGGRRRSSMALLGNIGEPAKRRLGVRTKQAFQMLGNVAQIGADSVIRGGGDLPSHSHRHQYRPARCAV